MPRVNTNDYKYTDADGHPQVFKAVFEVSASGIFFVNIPDWLADNAEAIVRNFDTYTFRPKVHLRIEGKRLIDVQNAVSAALREYSKPEVSTELVIRYTVTSRCAAWQMPDGTFAPNGHVASTIASAQGRSTVRGENGCGEWVKFRREINATNRIDGGYSVMIGAAVYQKVTTVRGSAVNVKYEKCQGSYDASSQPIYLLNSFTSFDLNDRARDYTLEEMSYTPEAAMFFYNMLLGITSLAVKMEEFFCSKDKLMSFIASGQNLLSAPGGDQQLTKE
jgi:hypothetical protein